MSNKFKAIMGIVGTLGIIILFFWFISYFSGESAMNEPVKLVCKPGKTEQKKKECYLTAHVHANIKVFKSEKEINLGFEFGNLERNHIHSQKNILHWHGLIKVNKKPEKLPSFEELTQFDDFKLSYIPQDLNLPFKTKSKFILNGRQVSEFEKWKAGDSIEIYYE